MGTAGVDWLEKFELAPLRDPVWARVGTLARRARRGPGAWPSSRPHGVCEPAASNPDGFKRSRVLRNQVWSFTRTDVPLPTASAPWKGGWVSSHPEGCCNRGNATYGWSWLSSHFPGQSQGWRQHRTWRLTIHSYCPFYYMQCTQGTLYHYKKFLNDEETSPESPQQSTSVSGLAPTATNSWYPL